MVCHFPAGRRIKKSSSVQASVWDLMQHYKTIQSEIFQAIDKAYLNRSSNLKEKLIQLLFLSLLQQTHIKTIRFSGRKDSGRLKGILSSATKCRRIIYPSQQTPSSSSTETTSWLNVRPFPVTEAKPIAHTYQKISLKDWQEFVGCKQDARLRKRLKSLGG